MTSAPLAHRYADSNMHQTCLHPQQKQAITRREGGDTVLDAIAPIKQLPDDVLRHLFELLCDHSSPLVLPLTHSIQSYGSMAPQITLSHVCPTWREIMLDIRMCWSNVKVDLQYLKTPGSSMVKVVNTWLFRAKGLPCSIDIHFSENDTHHNWINHWNMDWHKNIIKDLISLHKFKTLRVTFTDRHLRDFLQLPDDKLSCLKHLSLRYISQDKIIKPTSSFDLHKLSNLTSFSLLPISPAFAAQSDPLKDYFRFAGIPWHNLRHIEVHTTMPALFCLDMLRGCSVVLETCCLVVVGDRAFTSSPQLPVHLSRLRKLKLVDYSIYEDEKVLEHFLFSLRFPTLKSLTLNSPYYYSISVDVDMLLKVQNASRTQLEELIISGSCHSFDVHMLLTGFPSLRRLELPDMVIFTDDAMNEVGQGSLGIFLEHLTIKDSNLDLEKLLQMVRARSLTNEKNSQFEITVFKSVTFYSTDKEDEVEDRALYLMEEIKTSGVDLKVVFWGDPR